MATGRSIQRTRSWRGHPSLRGACAESRACAGQAILCVPDEEDYHSGLIRISVIPADGQSLGDGVPYPLTALALPGGYVLSVSQGQRGLNRVAAPRAAEPRFPHAHVEVAHGNADVHALQIGNPKQPEDEGPFAVARGSNPVEMPARAGAHDAPGLLVVGRGCPTNHLEDGLVRPRILWFQRAGKVAIEEQRKTRQSAIRLLSLL